MSGEFEVGYGKPPVSTRFSSEKGKGNRKGRRAKGTRNLKTDLFEILAERVQISVNGKPVRVSNQRALIKSLIFAGIKGNTSAADKILDKVLRLEGIDDGPRDAEALSAEDQAILDAFMKLPEISNESE